MSAIPLTPGPLRAAGFTLYRSGFRWLCGNRHVCRPNELIASCNLHLEPQAGTAGSQPFSEEFELHVAFAPSSGGLLHIADRDAPGGFANFFGVHPWNPDDVLAHFEPAAGPSSADQGGLRLLLLAGRRVTKLADVYAGLLAGWHNRTRAWWPGDGDAPVSTLLSLGICDATGVVLGDRSDFADLFEAASFPMQTVFVPDHPIAPCAPVLVEQLTRTPAQLQAIAADLRRGLSGGSEVPTADDWLFAGALLSMFGQSPIRDDYRLLTPAGLRKAGPAEAILLSLHAEPPTILRHRRLGYSLHIVRHRLAAAGPAVRAWLATAFERVGRTVDDIRRDYLALIDAVAGATGGRLLILNRMSTSGHEDISNYAAFDRPLGGTLANIASKELNLMLHDLADERDVAIVDVDAMAAEMGGGRHLIDGIHQSGSLQAVLRAEVLRIVQATRRGAISAAFR